MTGWRRGSADVMRLLPSMHLVASGRAGFELTDAYDFHAYLVTGRTAAMLIDAGAGRPPDAVAAAVREME